MANGILAGVYICLDLSSSSLFLGSVPILPLQKIFYGKCHIFVNVVIICFLPKAVIRSQFETDSHYKQKNDLDSYITSYASVVSRTIKDLNESNKMVQFIEKRL